MTSIKVFVYSYKNKNLLEFCESLKLRSFNDVIIDVYDQNTVDRSFIFKKNIDYIRFNHIPWDDRKGPYYHRIKSLGQKFDYFLSISDSCVFTDNWDQQLIDQCESKTVISGRGSVSLKTNKFFVEDSVKISNGEKTQWINKDFIFLKMSDAVLLAKSKFLKSYGDSLLSSILFTKLGFTIKSMPSYFYTTIDKEETYLPYSKYHGYNKLLSMIINKKIESTKFEQYHNLDLSTLKLLPFETDDVPYYKTAWSLDSENETRFHTTLKKIEIK